MKLVECVKAYGAAQELSEKEWDYKTAYALVVLKRRLAEPVGFYSREEMKLVAEYAEKDEKGNVRLDERGTFTFAQPERAGEYIQKRQELGQVEADWPHKPLRAPAPGFIKPAQLEALEGFLTFEEEEA